MKVTLSEKENVDIYEMIRAYYDRYLKHYGVKLPRLKGAKGFTKNALILIYLAQGYPETRKATKRELTEFIRGFYPRTNDVQQARHLGAQQGWFIAAGGRDNRDVVLRRGEYQPITLERPYPAFHGHRVEETDNWESLKEQYGYRCATCGSKEGEPNIHYPNTVTRLQKSHKDPNKPLVPGNIIPQCQKCNRADGNNWVYDERGGVIKLANPNVIKRSDREIRWKVYKNCIENSEGKTLMNREMLNKIILGDAKEVLLKIESNSIDLVLTDPPYFLDKMDNSWNHKTVSTITDYCHTVKSLPPGMKFDKEQGKRFYEWYFGISKELYRVLKPGGFFFSFSSPRLYHRMVSAIDDADFLIRDCFIWLYTQNQPKAMSLNHFIDKSDRNEKTKIELKKKLNGWKTPQIKSCFEPIVMAQKEYERTFLNNMLKYNVGLLNTNVKIGQNMFPSNVITTQEIDGSIDKYFLLPKPTKEEKGEFNIHKTVKPLAICEYIVQLTTFSEDAIVLDPFVGSGTTAVAAKKLGRNFIGIDTNREYIEIALKRLQTVEKGKAQSYKSKKLTMQLTLLEGKGGYSGKKKSK